MLRTAPSLALRRALIWGLAVVMLAMSLLGALATTHEALHVIDGSAAFAHEHGPGDDDAHPPTPTDASAFDELVHGLAHAWHCCGVTMAVLPAPVAKLLSAPPPLIPAFDARSAPAPALQGLFRPPIR
jgi:hypothetical protein